MTDAAKTVILVWTGEYEDQMVFLVASSEESAVAALKAAHPEPYKVVWRRTEYGMEGTFEAVNHYSTKHTARYEFEERKVV